MIVRLEAVPQPRPSALRLRLERLGRSRRAANVAAGGVGALLALASLLH